MANYDQLPVFKAAYDMLLDVYHTSRNMQREYRYTLGEEMKKEMMRLLMCIYHANLTHNKEPYLLQAREHIEMIKLQVRLLHDLKQLPLKNRMVFMLKYESVSKQLAAWHKSVKSVNNLKAGRGESPPD